MGEPARKLISYAEYLAAEQRGEIKHEYLDGAVVAMAGGTIAHGELSGLVFATLFQRLQGRSCRVYNSDVRVHVEATGLTTYPDVTVVCGPRRTAAVDDQALTNPVLLVEVLSPSTAAYDRGEKFEHYQRIESLREYVLVSPDRPRVERYCRIGDGTWSYVAAGSGDRVRLDSLDIELDVGALYAGMTQAEGTP